MKRHDLMTESEFFRAVCGGLKTFEIRRDDRGFEVGDELVLREIRDDGFETGSFQTAFVTYLLRDRPEFGLMPGFVIMGIEI